MADPVDAGAGILSGGLSGIFAYWWIILAFVILISIGAVVWWIKKYKQKNGQWTHKLYITSELASGELDKNITIINMRRWKHKDIKTAPLFELEKPLIGSRIFVELERYSNQTSYEVVLGIDGRLYIPTKTTINRDKNAKEVSVKHAGVDRTRQEYHNDFEKQNATPSKMDVATLIKLGLYATALVVVLVLGLSGFKYLGDSAAHKASTAQSEAQTWDSMGDTMDAVNSALNTVTLILPDLKEMYGNNIQGAINGQKTSLNQS